MPKNLLQKIFSIKNTDDKSRKIITIFGIKFKVLNANSYAAKKRDFLKKHKKYINRNKKGQIRRLFITTGNYSLLNVLTLIKQQNRNDCEDVLIIVSHVIKEDFNKYNTIIAKEHNFKQVIILDGPDYDKKYEYFVENELYCFDEVYASSMGSGPRFAQLYYPYSKKYLVDEGILGYIYQPYIDYNMFDAVYMNDYSEKIDFFGHDAATSNKFLHIDKNLFKSVTKNIQNKFPEIFNLNKEDKYILICGTCCEFLGLNEEEYSKYITDIITKLKNFGYNVIFKPHPRETHDLTDLGIKIVNTPLPLEMFDLDNIVAVISFCSLTATQAFYLRNVPGYQINDLDYDLIKISNQEKLHKVFIFEYTPSYKELFFDCKDLDFYKLREVLLEKSNKFLLSKDKLSQNKKMLQTVKDLNIKLMNDNKKV